MIEGMLYSENISFLHSYYEAPVSEEEDDAHNLGHRISDLNS